MSERVREKQEPFTNFPSKAEKFIQNLEEATEEKYSADLDEKQPAWVDSDDEVEEIRENRKRTLVVSTEANLRKFKKLVGEPEWARNKPQLDSSDEEAGIKYTGKIEEGQHKFLKKEILGIKKVRNLNKATYSEKNVTSVIFHPTSTVAICTGLNGIVNIYAVDGIKNDKLHSVGYKDFDISQARLIGGQEIVIGGRKPFFHTFDLMTSKSVQNYLPKTITKLKEFEVSPDEKLIAVKGRFGEIHLLNARTKELIKSLKQEHNVSKMAFSLDSRRLFCHSISNEVSVFDLTTFRLCHKFVDDGCIHGSQICVGSNFIATGSGEGIVNIYEPQSVLQSQFPVPVKTVSNLTTQITELQFNSSNEILAVGSENVEEAVRMVHFPSATVFMNFPGMFKKLGRPTVMAFSPKSGYFAIGNRESTVSLFRLKHYPNY